MQGAVLSGDGYWSKWLVNENRTPSREWGQLRVGEERNVLEMSYLWV